MQVPIVNETTSLDADVFPSRISEQLTLTNADAGNPRCIVLPAAATISADAGLWSVINIPSDYGSSPQVVIKGVLDGAPAATTIAFTVKLRAVADNEAWDQAVGTENTASAASVSQVDEDQYEEIVTISDTLAAGDQVNIFVGIDDSVHTYTGQFLLTDAYFEYTPA